MSLEIIEKLNAAVSHVEIGLENVSKAQDIDDARIASVGRKGAITLLSREMKSVPSENKREVGMAFNAAKNKIEELLSAALAKLEEQETASEANGIDLTLPGRKWHAGTKHPVTKVMDECVAIFRRMGFIVADGPEIETVYNNFDALNSPKDHPARDPRDTFYFDDGRLLRTQTSPIQIRVMEKQDPPIRIVAPGRTFRRDTPDATHSMNFHQIEGLYINKDVSLADLKSILLAFAHDMFGDTIGIRMRPHFFPFTEPSVEVDFSCIMCEGKGCRICKNSGWIEIAGAGMVDPNVLESVGYNPEEVSGFAFGFGIERIAMLKYRIGDIRYLYENDKRFLTQF